MATKGFILGEATRTLVWPEGHELAGLEVTLRADHSLGEMFEISQRTERERKERLDELRAQVEEDPSSLNQTEVLLDAEKLRHEQFVRDELVSWNLVRADGTPVPPTAEGLRSIDKRIATAIIRESVRNPAPAIPDPLGEPSNDGEPAEETEPPRSPST